MLWASTAHLNRHLPRTKAVGWSLSAGVVPAQAHATSSNILRATSSDDNNQPKSGEAPNQPLPKRAMNPRAMNPRKRTTIDSYFTKPAKAPTPSPTPAADKEAQQIAEVAPAEIQILTGTLGPAAGDAPGSNSAANDLPVPLLDPNAGSNTATVPRLANGPAPPSFDLLELLLEPTWRSALEGEFSKPYFQSLQKFVAGELAAGKSNIYPSREHIFRAFNSCPFHDVKVVILGQDPYHGQGQAMGLSFSVPPGVPIPSSLRNIFKELLADLGCAVPRHGNLEKWSGQGVLLLNAVLTVRAGEAASHSRRGWEQVTDAAIKLLSTQRTGIVFMLWGKLAQEKVQLIDSRKHHVLTAAHPSGLSAHKGFFGCQHFSKANKLLVAAAQSPVDWCIK